MNSPYSLVCLSSPSMTSASRCETWIGSGATAATIQVSQVSCNSCSRHETSDLVLLQAQRQAAIGSESTNCQSSVLQTLCPLTRNWSLRHESKLRDCAMLWGAVDLAIHQQFNLRASAGDDKNKTDNNINTRLIRQVCKTGDVIHSQSVDNQA